MTVAEELERALQLAGGNHACSLPHVLPVVTEILQLAGGKQGTAGSDLPSYSPSCPPQPPAQPPGSLNLCGSLHMSPAFSVNINNLANVKVERLEDLSYHDDEGSLLETEKCLVKLEQAEVEVGSRDIEEAGLEKSHEHDEPALEVGHTEADYFHLMDHNYSKLKCNFEDCRAEFASDGELSRHKKIT